MKVLLDENLPHELRHLLIGHDVYTVSFLKWKGTQNGALLQRAATDAFDVLLTLDNGVRYQHNLHTIPIAVIIMSSPSSGIDDLRSLVPKVLNALATLVPRSVVRVP